MLRLHRMNGQLQRNPSAAASATSSSIPRLTTFGALPKVTAEKTACRSLARQCHMPAASAISFGGVLVTTRGVKGRNSAFRGTPFPSFFPPPRAQPTDEQQLEAIEKKAIEDMRKKSFASLDVEDLYSTNLGDCPHGNVIGIMRPNEFGILTASPGETLNDIIPRLNQVTGLPVLGADGRVTGVISRTDIIKIRKGKVQGTMEDLVSKHMTTPAIVVPRTATVQDTADLMLAKKIRRLPVVDENGFPVGIVSRSDIFKPLFAEAYSLFMEKEVAALSEGASSSSSPVAQAEGGKVKTKKVKKPVEWKIKYLYDGDCPMCASLMNVLKRQDNNRNLIKFVNIADVDYKPKNHMGVTYDEAMETIHAIQPDGTVIRGTQALEQLFDAVGLGWATKIMELPIINKLVDILYNFLSANRLSMGGALDGIIAAKRMDMAKAGVHTCADVDEECAAEW